MAYTNNNGQTRIGVRIVPQVNASSLWNSIYSVYNADAVGSSSLKTSLFAAYNGESNANDSFGSNNGTPQGGLTYGTGKIGNAFQFNGTNAYVDYSADAFKFTSNYSVSFWYNASSTSFQSLIDCYSNVGGKRGWAIQNTGTAINFKTFKDNVTYSDLNYTISTNTWYHVSVVRKSGVSSKIYLNGALVVSDSVTTDQNYLSNYSLIGAINDNGTLYNYTSGKLDAVNVWNKELTQSEITELYNSGNGAQYIGDNFYKPTTNDVLGTNNGTAQGGLTYGVGKVGTAFVGNGTNAYITLANNSFKFTNSQSFSISTWVNITNSNVSNIIFSSWLFSGSQGYGWLLRTSPYSSTQCNLAFITDWQGGSGTPIPLSVSNAFTINTWVFVTATRNGSTGVEKIYVNGSQIATRTLTPNYLYTSNTVYPSILAQKYDSSSVSGYLNGKIDELNIWTKELTSTEVTELYNSGNGKQYPN